MNTKEILATLRAERDKLDKAITALEALGETPQASTKASVNTTKSTASKPKKRVMSAAGRKRIAEAQRARWAARKTSKTAASEKKEATPTGTAQRRVVRVKNAPERLKA
jgi:hypothetical protein